MDGLAPFMAGVEGGPLAAGFTIHGLPELEAFLARFQQPQIGQRFRWAFERVAAKVLADAVEDVDKDTGTLAESGFIDTWGDSLDTVGGMIGFSEPYAIVREFGRRPASEIGLHPPPEGALLGWMGRHEAPAAYTNLSEEAREDALRWGIAIKGSPPHPFLRPALWANQRYALTTLVEALMSDTLPGVQTAAA